MDFTLCPDDGPPRLIRFVSADELPTTTTLYLLDSGNNLLRVNRELFEQLTSTEQQRVITTRTTTEDKNHEAFDIR